MCTTFSANKRGIRATLPVPSSSAGMTKKFGVMVVTAGSIPAICNWRAAGVKAPRPLTVIIQGDFKELLRCGFLRRPAGHNAGPFVSQDIQMGLLGEIAMREKHSVDIPK